jgi:formylglycine-generating enzyme required for sulfatase activity/tetratricopeptide (TPR) repeat protein
MLEHRQLYAGISPQWARAWGEDSYGVFAVVQIAGVSSRMRWIAPGEFSMGSPPDEAGRSDDEGPQHLVRLPVGYWLGETLVTQELWRAVMGQSPSRFRGAERPVEQVGWKDCLVFCAKVGAAVPGLFPRLPTEAEWEYACRAGAAGAGSLDEANVKGVGVAELGRDAWYADNSGGETHPVGRKEPNVWGLYDMLGNVCEWCLDATYVEYGAEECSAPFQEGDGHLRVARGGSWAARAGLVRPACRFSRVADARYDYLGLRLAAGQESALQYSISRQGRRVGVVVNSGGKPLREPVEVAAPASRGGRTLAYQQVYDVFDVDHHTWGRRDLGASQQLERAGQHEAGFDMSVVDLRLRDESTMDARPLLELRRTRDSLERTLATDLEELGQDHPSIANTRANLALVLKDLGDLPRAKELLELALASDLQNLGEDHPSVATRRSNLAGVLQDLGDLPGAKELLERALASDLQNLGEDHPSVATLRSNLALVLQARGDLPRAKELLERALASDLQNLGEDHPSVATRRSNLAAVLEALGDLPRAKELHERALASDLQNLGEDHPSVAIRRANLATVLKNLGDLPRAKELLERALASALQNLGEDHPRVATCRSNLAMVLQDLGDLPRAKELLERALASALQNLGEDHPSVATLRSNLALVLQALGDLPRAKELLERALASDLQNLGEDHPSVANRRSNLAMVLQDLGDLPRAKELLEQALASDLQNLGEDHPSVATRRSNLATVLQDLGDLPRAKELLRAGAGLGPPEPRRGPSQRRPTSRSNLATVLKALGDLPRAKELLERALASDLQNRGDDDPSLSPRGAPTSAWCSRHSATCREPRTCSSGPWPRTSRTLARTIPASRRSRNNLATVLQDLGDRPGAKELLERALASDLQNLGEDHPSVATRRSNLATVLQDLGDLTGARDLIERALASDLQNLGEDHPSVGTCRFNLATIHEELGALDDARREFAAALASEERSLGPSHPSTAHTRVRLAAVLARLRSCDGGPRRSRARTPRRQQSARRLARSDRSSSGSRQAHPARGMRSLRSAFASIWRMRSRVTSKP